MPVFENRDSYLFVTLTEPYSLQGTFLFLADLAERCRQEHLDKALVDGSRLQEHISIWDRYQIGREYVRLISPKIAVAVVLSPTLINRVAENVAVNRSGRLKAFHEMEAALQWLESERRRPVPSF